MGRPSKRTDLIEEAIIDRLMEGYSLRKICDDESMPDRRTILRWMEADAGFASKCARARELQADLMDDKIIDAAEDTTPENAAAMRVKIAAYQWRAAKLAPKKYGDKVSAEVSGPDGGAIPVQVIERRIVDPKHRDS